MSDGLNTNRDLDHLLDSALSTYADPGPHSGLEDRILARIASANKAPQRSRNRLLFWTLSLAAAACLLFAFVLSGAKTKSLPAGHVSSLQTSSLPPQPPRITARAYEPQQSTASKTVPSLGKQGGIRAIRAVQRPATLRRPLPKLEIFPAPQPLSPEERILARFATQAAPDERALLLDAQRPPDAPLHIATINIPPLEPLVQGEN